MANICPVCGNSVSFLTMVPRQGFNLHLGCINEFHRNPEKYGGKAIKKTEAQIKAEKEHKEHKEHQKKEPSDKDFVTTLLICIFLGGIGGHRFFVGKQETAMGMLVMPIAAGFFIVVLDIFGMILFAAWGLWYLFDVFQIVTSSFEDSEGRVIVYQAAGATNTTPGTHVPEKVVEAPPAKDIPAEIEKLADLKDKGIITDEEFQQKKQELLDRI